VANFDHLSTVDSRLTGVVVATNPLAGGAASYILVDGSGIDLGNRRRWLGHSSEVNSPEKLRVGDRISFLPGPSRKGAGKLARAFDITKLPADEKTKSSQAPAGK
jgi:hypothetical protein